MSDSLQFGVVGEKRISEDRFGFTLEVLADTTSARKNHPFELVTSGSTVLETGETDEYGAYQGSFILPINRGTREAIRVIVQGISSPNYRDLVVPSDSFLRKEAAEEEARRLAERERYLKTIQHFLSGEAEIDNGKTLVLRREVHDINGTMYIAEGGKMVVPAGAVLRFGEKGGIAVRGALEVEGTPNDLVLFHGLRRGETGWLSIDIHPWRNAGSHIRYAVIEDSCGGGAIHLRNCGKEVELSNLIIRNNGGFGGLVIVNSSPTLRHLEICNNRGVMGGGIHAEFNPQGRLDNLPICIVDSNIHDNEASKHGGGIYLADVTANLLRCKVSDNVAQRGGGIYLHETSGVGAINDIKESEQLRMFQEEWNKLNREPRRKIPLDQISISPDWVHKYIPRAKMRLTLDGCRLAGNRASESGGGMFISWAAVANGTGNTISRDSWLSANPIYCEALGYKPSL